MVKASALEKAAAMATLDAQAMGKGSGWESTDRAERAGKGFPQESAMFSSSVSSADMEMDTDMDIVRSQGQGTETI